MLLCNKNSVLRNVVVCLLMQLIMAEDESWLVFTTNDKIIVRPLSNNQTNETHIPSSPSASALTFDFEDKKFYWSNYHIGDKEKYLKVKKVNIDGTSLMDVTFPIKAQLVTGLALDWITKNLYLTHEEDHQIKACDLRIQLCAVLVHGLEYAPFKIALHPQSGTMVWTNLGEAIFKANMDGSNPTRIAAEKNAFFSSITIDHALSHLYWINYRKHTVYTSDFEGANESTLESIGNTSIRARSVAVTGPDIYWYDRRNDSIKKCNKNDGSLFEVEKSGVVGLKGLFIRQFDMLLVGSKSQPHDRVNHCANHSCEYICVLTKTSSRCMCPVGLNVSKDGQQFEDVGPKMLISSSSGTHVLSITTLKMTTLSSSSPSWGLTYDFENSKIYWAGGTYGSTIFRSAIDGSSIESIVTVSGEEYVWSLAYDWIAHNIYYTTEKHVGVCDYSGKNCAVLFHASRELLPAIALFPRSGLMFWSSLGDTTNSITRSGMDGSFLELMYDGIDPLSNLVIDTQISQLYWLHEERRIITTDLDVKTLRSHRPTLHGLTSVAVDGDWLYWMNDNTVQRCNKYRYDSLETVKNFNWDETVFEMSFFHREGQLQDRINHCAAGGLCSHICVLTHKYFRCICPTGMFLNEDDRTCTESQRDRNLTNSTVDGMSSYAQLIFKPEDDNGGRFGFRGNSKVWVCADGTFVDLADICNGTLGCPDGTDEARYCDIPCNNISRIDDGKDCTRTPNGPEVVCPQGFVPGQDKATCEDVDECLEAVCENHCINTMGSFECRDLPEGSDSLGVALAGSLSTIFAIAVAIFFGVKYIQTRKILRKLTPEEVQEFLDGDENAANTSDLGADKAMLMPFRLVIQPEDVVIAKDAILGSGQFGVVYRGFHNAEAVAIKTFKRTVEIDEFKAVLAEAKIMAYIRDHANVVRFIGADVSRIADRKLVLVTELSPHGDLLGYLRKIEPSKWTERTNDTNHGPVSPTNLVEWCEQIACGMQYLEQVKIVHGDLAARNVLVFKDNVVKITDFGLSKQLYGNSEYLMKRQRMLPWKWSALELLTRREFSTDSDIWAFGVTAWEIFSLGRQPYDEIAIGMEFIQYLEQGHRLPKPIYATTEIYEILKSCWNAERSSRPRFERLREFFHENSTKDGVNSHVKNLMATTVNVGYAFAI